MPAARPLRLQIKELTIDFVGRINSMTFIFQTREARCGLKTPGMGKRDTELGIFAARRGVADDTAFHSNSDRCTVSGNVAWICYSDYPSSQCRAMPIVQRDILTIDGLIGSLEGFRIACLVIAVGVFGGNGEAARMGNRQAPAAVGRIDLNLIRGIGGGPHLRRGDGIPRRRRDSAAYRCGVSWGWTRRVIAGIEQEDREQRPGLC